MALSPADFAAYSRATGTPYPEDPEERAALAPEVIQFRQNQLRAPQQESNPLAALGAAALGIGALAGGAALSRRLGRVPAQATASTQPNLTQKGIQDVSAIGRQRSVEESIRQARQERPTGIVQTDLSAVNKLLDDPELKQLVQKQSAEEQAELRSEMARQQARVQAQKREDLWNLVQEIREEAPVVNQTIGALESGEDQMTGRVMRGVQRNEDLDASQVNEVARQTGSTEVAASLTPDGIPSDQAEGLTVLDLNKKESFRITPRALSQETEDPLPALLREARLALEVDSDYDYSAENRRQAAQVQDRIQRAKALQSQATQILDELKAEAPIDVSQADPKAFAAAFNKQYREELSDQIRSVDNARQRAELAATEANEIAQDLESLLVGERSPVDESMRGGALRGGKPNITGDIIYQDESGRFASAETGIKTRQEQGPQFKAKAETLNRLYRASDEDLTYLITQNQQARASNQPITKLEDDTARLASHVLRQRAVNNPEPTKLQLDALERARASIDATQQILQESRNLRPTLSPGPAQDVARSMETLRRGMIVEPSEEIPTYPSVQTLRTGYVSEEQGDIGPVLGASDVYTGAAAEAAGPVIFTGKSRAESVIRGPEVIGTVQTPVGTFLTQDNPDVLGTVYNVAGTPANRRISAQVESNAQRFLADAVAGGLTTKTVPQVEPYRTPGTYGVQQFNLLTPPISQKGLLPLQQSLGLTGPEASQRTGYAQYQPGRSTPVPLSPFIGEMAGGTVIATPQTTELPVTRRDIGAPARSIDLTRRGAKSRYYSDDPAYPTYVTNMEPASIGPLTQSPGLSRIGGLYETPVLGAGGVPILELTTRGQNISYPRMPKATSVPTYKGRYQGSFYGPQGTIANVPRYGIDPGGDWQKDLMRSAYRRGGPIKTYQG